MDELIERELPLPTSKTKKENQRIPRIKRKGSKDFVVQRENIFWFLGGC